MFSYDKDARFGIKIWHLQKFTCSHFLKITISVGGKKGWRERGEGCGVNQTKLKEKLNDNGGGGLSASQIKVEE